MSKRTSRPSSRRPARHASAQQLPLPTTGRATPRRTATQRTSQRKAPRPTGVVLPCGCSATSHCPEGGELREIMVAAIVRDTVGYANDSRGARGRYYEHRGELIHPSIISTFLARSMPGGGTIPHGLAIEPVRIPDAVKECRRCGEVRPHEYTRLSCRICWAEQRRAQYVRARDRRNARMAEARTLEVAA